MELLKMKKILFIIIFLFSCFLFDNFSYAQEQLTKEEMEIIEQFKKVSEIEENIKKVQESAAQQIQMLNDQRSAAIGVIEYIRNKYSIDMVALQEKLKLINK